MFQLAVQTATCRKIATFQQVVDHTLQAEFAAVVGVINSGDTVLVQFFDLTGQYGAAAAAVYFDVSGSFFFQQVVHVFKKFHVAALITRDGDTLSVFLDGGVHDFLYAAVVAEVDDFGAAGLQDAAHDVDGGVVAVEKRSGGHDAHFIFRMVGRYFFHGRAV